MYTRRKGLCGLLLLCLTAGCVWVAPKDTAGMKTHPLPQGQKILNAERLQKGGRMVVVPFRAGVGVEATDELDKIALMIVKGVADLLKKEGAHFEVMTGENADQADFLIQGHITHRAGASGLRRWILRSKTIELGIEAKMMDIATQQTILVFTQRKETTKKARDYRELGYEIGEDLGRFILITSEFQK